MKELETLDFSVEEICNDDEPRDNSDVQSGCWGDTGSGAYC